MENLRGKGKQRSGTKKLTGGGRSDEDIQPLHRGDTAMRYFYPLHPRTEDSTKNFR